MGEENGVIEKCLEANQILLENSDHTLPEKLKEKLKNSIENGKKILNGEKVDKSC